MADLVIGNDELFLFRKDAALFLVSGDDDLDAFLHVRLRGKAPSVADCPERRFVYDIGKLRAGSAGSGFCDLVKIDVVRNFDLLA